MKGFSVRVTMQSKRGTYVVTVFNDADQRIVYESVQPNEARAVALYLSQRPELAFKAHELAPKDEP
jgi:hypothetical protein